MLQEVHAKLRFLRIGPRKVRLVADLMRGRRVEKAVTMLSVLNKRAAKPLLKLLNSAVANAQHNFSLAPATLRVSKITVDGGPALKRWMPKAHGRATPIREATSHITITLVGEKAEVEQKEKPKPKEKKLKEKNR
jgi:large subunit ribosomal protein L22